MLRITLYKNCILNETYANVFSLGLKSNKSILEHYLDTLNKKVYEINFVYQENSGTLVFDFDIDVMSNIYDFNYMKVETIDEDSIKILRYCFIQNISIKNELVYLEYEEDIWHSYINKINGINESYVDASRLINYGNNFSLKVRTLPFEFQGNKKLLFSSVDTFSKFIAVFELQAYYTSGQGDQTYRKTMYVFADGTEYETGIFGKTIKEIETLLSSLEQNKPNYIFIDRVGAEYKYEIGDIYIIPIEFINLTDIEVEGKIGIYMPDHSFSIRTNVYKILNDLLSSGLISSYSKTIQNNFKLISIGTLSSQFKIIPNGNEFSFEILYSCSLCNFVIKLNINNTIVDITNDFLYQLPISSLNSEQLSQLKIARNTSKSELKEDLRIANAELVQKEVENTAKIAKGSEKVVKGSILAGATGGLVGTGKIVSGVSDIAIGTSAIVTDAIITNANKNKIKAEISRVDAPVYTSNNGNFGNSPSFINAKYGIVILSVNSQNDDFVKKALNNLGFIAYEFLNDISKLRINDADFFILNEINYNVISFKSVSCYGSFPRSIAKILNGILESGVKIWYNENMQDDNYINGVV